MQPPVVSETTLMCLPDNVVFSGTMRIQTSLYLDNIVGPPIDITFPVSVGQNQTQGGPSLGVRNSCRSNKPSVSF